MSATHGVITYDVFDEWLVETDFDGAARIVARDVPQWFGQLVGERLAAPPPLDGPDDPDWPYSFIVNRREYEALVALAKIANPAHRTPGSECLWCMDDLPEHEDWCAATIARAALRDEGETP